MASRYWVGGTAAWDGTAGTKWATTSGGAGGAAEPTSADDVFFDAASGAITCTLSSNASMKSLNCTGFTGTITGTGYPNIYGSMTLSAGMTWTQTGFLTFKGTGTVTTNGKTLQYLLMDTAGVTVTLGSALTVGDFIQLDAGTFTTANYSVTATSRGFSARATGVTLNLGSSTITVSSWADGGATVNAGTSTINLPANGSFSSTGTKNYDTIAFTSTSPSGSRSISASGGVLYVVTLSFGTLSGTGIATISVSGSLTITSMTCTGSAPTSRYFLTGPATLTFNSTWSPSDVDFTRITKTSTALTGTRLGDCGGNSNITFPAAKNVYWNLAGSQNWSATGWATTSGGSPAAANFPLPQDTAIINQSSAGSTITFDASWNVGNFNASARTSSFTFANATTINVYGTSWTFGSGITTSGAGTLYFASSSTATLTSNSAAITWGVTCAGGGLTFADNASLTNATTSLTLVLGTLNLNGKTVTCSGVFDADQGSTRNLTFNGGTLSLSGSGATFLSASTSFTTTAGTGTGKITFTSASAKTFAGSGVTYNCTIDQGGAGALTITGANTMTTLSNTYSATGATTITLAANQTVTNFTAAGAAGKVLTLNSSVNGTARTLTKTSGTVNVDYMSIRDSTATGGATWYAGSNSTNVSNNSGWIFSAAPTAGGGGNFLTFF